MFVHVEKRKPILQKAVRRGDVPQRPPSSAALVFQPAKLLRGISKRWTGPYIAPSWSWASVNGPVVSYKDIPGWPDAYATVQEVSIGLVDNASPFGQVRAVEICLYGNVFSACVGPGLGVLSREVCLVGFLF